VTTQPQIVTTALGAGLAGYARRLHDAAGPGHHVASPLGAWLLLALCAPASSGRDQVALTQALGCDTGTAAGLAAGLLARPHPLVPSAAAVWTRSAAPLSAAFRAWQDELPAVVERGELTGQDALDAWARDRTAGLIERFPLNIGLDVYLVLASALATRVSWEVPFDLAPGRALGRPSPWARQLRRVLRTPDPEARPLTGGPSSAGPPHQQFIAVTEDAGDVAVHLARARGGLLVASVAAAADVPAAAVLAAAQRLASAAVTGDPVPRRALADLPLGDAPLWQVREENGPGADTFTAVLPAWSARSQIALTGPGLGFGTAVAALVPGDPWTAAQAAMARYSRTGFEAAAVSAVAVALAARLPAPGRHRSAELRFAHPYAVVAVTMDPGAAGAPPGPWHGVPVFSAWVADPADADPAGGAE
jgi:hypothetical protein